MNIEELLNRRYSTKIYDSNKKISQKEIEILGEALRLSPSSMGIQQWHFFIISKEDIKKQLVDASFGYNKGKVDHCSHVFVLAQNKSLDKKKVKDYMRLHEELRDQSEEEIQVMKEGYDNALSNLKDTDKWFSEQVHIALGFLLYSCAIMNIDSTPLGGVDKARYDEILGLSEKNLTTSVVVVVGYRAEDEDVSFQRTVRLPKEQVITHI